LSRDPIGESGGVNLYAMVGNSPVNLYDHIGLVTAEEVLRALINKILKCKNDGSSAANWNAGLDVLYTKLYGNNWKNLIENTVKKYKKDLESLSKIKKKIEKSAKFVNFAEMSGTDLIDALSQLAIQDGNKINKNEINTLIALRDSLKTANKTIVHASTIIDSINIASNLLTGDAYEQFGAVLKASSTFNNVPGIGSILGFYSDAYTAILNATEHIDNLSISNNFYNMYGKDAVGAIKNMKCCEIPGAIQLGGITGTLNAVGAALSGPGVNQIYDKK
jgi:hypothetical protein